MLGQSLEAGLPLIDCLLTTGGPKPRERRALADTLQRGAALEDALETHGAWIPVVDRHLILAGAHTGRLAETLRQLAGQHEVVARLTLRAWLAVAYPAAIVHFGAFVLPLKTLVMGSLPAYLAAVFATLIPLWFVIALIGIPLVRHASVRRRVFAFLPGLAGYQKARDLHAFATVLHGYVAAGLPLDVAWPAAGSATGSPRLVALGQRIGVAAAAGEKPGARLAAEPDFPGEFAALYRVGEQTGKLDENLGWITRQCADRAETKLKLVSMTYPAAVFLGVAAWVAITAIAGYAAYLNEILKLLE